MAKKRATRGRPRSGSNKSNFAGRVGARINQRREKLNRTVEEAAALAGVAAPTWYHWEAGRHLQLHKLPAIARALACDVRALIPPKERGDD